MTSQDYMIYRRFIELCSKIVSTDEDELFVEMGNSKYCLYFSKNFVKIFVPECESYIFTYCRVLELSRIFSTLSSCTFVEFGDPEGSDHQSIIGAGDFRVETSIPHIDLQMCTEEYKFQLLTIHDERTVDVLFLQAYLDDLLKNTMVSIHSETLAYSTEELLEVLDSLEYYVSTKEK